MFGKASNAIFSWTLFNHTSDLRGENVITLNMMFDPFRFLIGAMLLVAGGHFDKKVLFL